MGVKFFNLRANFMEIVDTWFPIGIKDHYLFFDVAEEIGSHDLPPAYIFPGA